MRQKKSKPLKSSGSIQKKILMFFLENEGSIDTPRGISTWIGSDIEPVTTELEKLAETGILKAHRISSTVGYSSALSKTALMSLIKEC